jgi:hypothetical protein
MPVAEANGGLTLEAYELVMDDGRGGEFTTVGASTDTGSSPLERVHALSQLTQGRIHRLKYRVRNSLGWSPYSPVSSLLVAGPPDRPTKPRLVGVSAASLSLEFDEVSDNGGSPIHSYQLYTRMEADASFRLVGPSDSLTTARTLTVAGDSLVAGKIHYFKVTATNQVATSEFSDISSFAVAPLPA